MYLCIVNNKQLCMEEVYNTIQLDKDIETISEVVDYFYNVLIN